MLVRLASGLALCAAVAAASLPARAALPTQYRLEDLGPATAGEHVNRPGQVAGVDSNTGSNQAFLWTAGSKVLLANPGDSAYAHWVNNAGLVVGSYDFGTTIHAALWTSPGTLVDIGAGIDSQFSHATAINDNNDCTINAVIVKNGHYQDHAFVAPGCDPALAVDIGSLGAYGTFAAAINLNGQVAGTSTAKYGRYSGRAFLYSNGVMKSLGVLDGYATSDARGLNGKGHVAGRCEDRNNHTMGYFHDGKKMVPVGTLGGNQSTAYAVNYFDVVVGTAQKPSRVYTAFVRDMATKDSPMQDLQTMLDASGAGWTLQRAVGINNFGQILVSGILAGDNAERSALLTPVD